MYAKFDESNTVLLQHPYSHERLILDNPDISWPEVISDELAESYHVFKVTPVDPPLVDPALQGVRESDPVISDGVCYQTWFTWEYSPEEIESLTATIRNRLKEEATEKRWEVETGGIVLMNGEVIKTGIDDKNRITTVIVNARLAGLSVVSFKTTSGWQSSTIEEIEEIAAVIGNHTNDCFNAERQHHDEIDSASYGDLLIYDMSRYWPT